MRLAGLFGARRPADRDSFPIEHGGRSFRIPARPGPDYLTDWMRRKRRFYELDLLEALAVEVPSGGVALDVGANIGNHALWFAAVMGLRTVAFEPVETNLAVLRRLVALNGLEDAITIVPLAISDAPGTLWLDAPDPENPGTFRAAAEGSGEAAEALPLDDALDRLGLAAADVALVKVDVEGHEEKVLAGARRLLADGSPVLALEIFDPGGFDAIAGRLGLLGYRAVAVYCATPTVVFRRGGADGGTAVRDRIAAYAAKVGPS
jgi:FkbM family methyltransferase